MNTSDDTGVNMDDILVPELGDVIRMVAPSNPEINGHNYYIYYLDDEKMKLWDLSMKTIFQLRIENYLADESIIDIELVYRNEEKGFARQNGLLPGAWINLYFTGDFPEVISGEITDLEEDRIEITTYPRLQQLYIDFAYIGIPEDIPLTKIVIGDRPAVLKTSLKTLAESGMGEEVADVGVEITDEGEIILSISETADEEPKTEAVVSDFIDKNAPIVDDEEVLGEMVVQMEVRESERRYSLEAQVADLVGELLMKIPVHDRTPKVLEDIHRLITRFKQVWREFSVFDGNENVVDSKRTGILYKPLVDRLIEMDGQFSWILPVVSNKRILTTEAEMNTPHISNREPADMYALIDNIKALATTQEQLGNQNGYERYMKTAMDTFSNNIPYDAAEEEFIVGSHLLVDQPVKHNTEVLYDTEGDFNNTVIAAKNPTTGKFYRVVQTTGETRMVQSMETRRKKVYTREEIVPADKVNVKSFLFLPKPFMLQSRVSMPSTRILLRSQLANIPPYLFRLFKKNTVIYRREIEDIQKELSYKDEPGKQPDDEEADEFLQRITNYVLTDTTHVLDAPSEDKIRAFLNAILPRTRTLIRWMRPYTTGLYSLSSIVSLLEPFAIEANSVTFKQYMEVRFHIIEKIKQYVSRFNTASAEYAAITKLKTGYPDRQKNRVYNAFDSNGEFTGHFTKSYRLDNETKIILHQVAETNSMSSSELLNHLLTCDNAQMYFLLIQYYMMVLVMPEDIMQSMESDNIDTSEKVASASCSTRYIAKKYIRLADLQKDNNETTYFDKSYDDTPYSIMDKYKDEKKRLSPEEFREFFEETLIQKYDCPPSMAPKLAETILLGKKPVEDGHYALLETVPTLPKDELDAMTEEEKRAAILEAGTRKKKEYYRRTKDHWVSDPDVDETAFVDTNSLFCDLAQECTSLAKTRQCVPNATAAIQLKLAKRAKILEEFDKRVVINKEAMEANYESLIATLGKFNLRMRGNQINNMFKQNDYNYSMGKYAVGTDNIVVSPYAKLLELILSQSDFDKRQRDILRFIREYTVEPDENVGDNPHWFYCRDAFVKLVPVCLGDLADAYIHGDYMDVLDNLCRTNGVLSDDGDSIVDKHSGYILRKIDYSTEEGFDESGFHIVTRAVVEQDFGTVIAGVLGKKAKVFENPVAQSAYNVFHAIAENIGIIGTPAESSLEEFVVRTSLETINNPGIIISEADYNERIQALKTKTDKAAIEAAKIPYIAYYNQSLVIIVACFIIVGVQTLIPSFHTKKTFPGCVASFTGYPLDQNIENAASMRYVACVLDKIKRSSAEPWKSIERLSLNVIIKNMRVFLRDHIVTRQDIAVLYKAKREYLVITPDEVVPENLNVAKWHTFMPPLSPVMLKSPAVGITDEFIKELRHSIQSGSVLQQNANIRVLYDKLFKISYGLVGAIQGVVHKKAPLLATTGGVFFLENACCNEGDKMKQPILYFAEENRDIREYMKKAIAISREMEYIRALSKASTFYDRDNTRITYIPSPNNITEDTVYKAYIHYCNFDTDEPIPTYLEVVCSEKPKYDRYAPLKEKILAMKKQGKNYTLDSYNELMRIVNGRNRIVVRTAREISLLNGFKDILEHLDLTGCTIIEQKLRDLLWARVSPKDAADKSNDFENTRNILVYLTETNGQMTNNIMTFIDKAGGLTDRDYDNMRAFLNTYHQWNLASAEHQIANSVYLVAKAVPSIIIGGKKYETVPRHWNFETTHNEKLQSYIGAFYSQYTAYFTEETKRGMWTSGGTSAPVFYQYMKDVIRSLRDVLVFAEQVPGISCILGADEREMIALLYKYIWLSCLNQYIVLSVEQYGQYYNETIPINKQMAEDLELYDYGADAANIREVNIMETDKTEFKRRAMDLIVAIIRQDMEIKTAVNMSYANIMENTQKLKYKDKKRITDYLAGLTADERKVEQNLRSHKLGRWNVGLQKGLYQYDKTTYRAEEEAMNQPTIGVREPDIVYSLEGANEINAAVEELQAEGDISGLPEEYDNGYQYEEDYPEEYAEDGY